VHAVEFSSLKGLPLVLQNEAKQALNKVVQSTSGGSNDVGVKIPTHAIKLKDHFKCSAYDLYRALTDQGVGVAYTMVLCRGCYFLF
jgi:hypothetical protein